VGSELGQADRARRGDLACSHGPTPHSSYLAPKDAAAELRPLLEHDAVRRPTPRTTSGAPVTFADAAQAWYEHGERKRNLKRSTLKDYRHVLDAYLLPAREGADTGRARPGVNFFESRRPVEGRVVKSPRGR
jgi:hypothetical protein